MKGFVRQVLCFKNLHAIDRMLLQQMQEMHILRTSCYRFDSNMFRKRPKIAAVTVPIMAPRVSIEPSCHISTPSSDITCGVSGYLRIWGNLFSRRHVRLRVIISIPEKWKRMPHSIQPLQAKAIGSSRCRTSDFLSGDGKNMQKLNLPFPSDGCVKMAFRCPWFA